MSISMASVRLQSRLGLPPKLRPVAACLAALGMCTSLAALAQTTSPEPLKDDKATGSVQSLDRVVITAGKRLEKLREVAGSVSAAQGTDLEARGTKDHEDLFKLVPGVQYNKGEGDTSVITIRGIGTGASFVQSTTGFYIEDVPFNEPYIFRTSPDVAPFDLSRVEVLRGPQGVLYGSSSMGGAVRYLLNRPNSKATEFSLLGSFSNTSSGGDNRSAYAMANLPLSETAGIRAVLFDRDDAGYIDNSTTQQKNVNKLHQSGGRVMVGLQPTKALSVMALLMTQQTTTDDGSSVENLATESRTNASLSPRKSSFDLGSLQVDYDFGAVKFTSNTSRLNKEWVGTSDLTRFAAFYGPGAKAFTNERSKATSQELRLASNDSGPLSWVLGGFYQRFVYDQQDGLLTSMFTLPSNILSKATEKAVFAQADYALTPQWTLGAGARYFRTDNDVVSAVNFVAGKAASTESGTTPRVSLKYKIDADSMVYGLVSKGYRFGGINITQFNPNVVNPRFVTPPTYKSDSLINYELGLRLSPAPTVRVDATAFLLDWTNLQLNIPRPGDGFGYTANIGKARSAGLELAVVWTPVTAFTWSTSAALTNASTKQDFPAPTGVVAGGTELPGTPKLQWTNQLSYSFTGPLQTSARATLTHAYVGKRYNDIYKAVQLDAYNTLDARWSFALERWELSLFANNLSNKKVATGATATPGFPTDYYLNKPRTVGLSVRYDL